MKKLLSFIIILMLITVLVLPAMLTGYAAASVPPGDTVSAADAVSMFEQINLTLLLSIVGGLYILVTIFTEVIKKVTWDKINTNLLVIIISLVLTFVALFAYCGIYGILVMWYYIAAAIVVGFMVAYAAMFGFDKLIKELNKKNGGDTGGT